MFLSFSRKLKQGWGFVVVEKELLSEALKEKKNQGRVLTSKEMVIKAPPDYYYLTLFGQLISEFREKDNYKVTAIGPVIWFPRPKPDLLFPVRVLYAMVNYFFLRRKWAKLYRAAGVDSFFDMTSVPLYKIP